jgi:hypothetical protein
MRAAAAANGAAGAAGAAAAAAGGFWSIDLSDNALDEQDAAALAAALRAAAAAAGPSLGYGTDRLPDGGAGGAGGAGWWRSLALGGNRFGRGVARELAGAGRAAGLQVSA